LEENHTAVVFDANVIIASLIRSGSLNRRVAIMAPLIYPCFQPEALKDEILKHEREIAGRAKKTIFEVRRGLKEILEQINTVARPES
jgi:predicted nucleic acid-binding protein